MYRKELRTIKGLKYFRLNALEVAKGKQMIWHFTYFEDLHQCYAFDLISFMGNFGLIAFKNLH
jgi:hypothetical protein